MKRVMRRRGGRTFHHVYFTATWELSSLGVCVRVLKEPICKFLKWRDERERERERELPLLLSKLWISEEKEVLS